jgi:cytochrome c-type biogenesis protein CcsB
MLITLFYAAMWFSWILYFASLRSDKRWIVLAGRTLLFLSLGFLTAGLVQRSLIAGHWPFANGYEFTLCFVWVLVAIYLLFEFSWGYTQAGSFVILIALLGGTYAITRPDVAKEISLLLPVLRSIWLQVHVVCLLIAYAALGVAAGLGLMRLVSYRFVIPDEEDSRLPLPAEVVDMIERMVALGFPWLTLGILTGSIWAQNAWGRYWGWDPKEVWALVIWLLYLLMLHIRTLRNWRDRRLAWLAVSGFGVIVFTFVGVPWLVRTVRLESLHGF